MLNELLARVQAYADERQLSMHRGKIKRVVYSAEDIVDGQYFALAIHFDRDRNAILEHLPEVDKSWLRVYENKMDIINTLDYDLHAYRSLYKHLVEAHLTKTRAIAILSDEKLLRLYQKTFTTLRDNTEPSELLMLFENILFDIDMVFECKA